MRKFLFLNSAQRFSDLALLMLRVFFGVYLLWGVWGEVTNPAHMQKYVSSLEYHRLPASGVLAPVFAYLQLAVSAGFILGLFTRWAGLVCAVLFFVMIVTIDRFSGAGGMFYSGSLVVVGLYLGTHGAGRLSVDAALRANELPRSNGGVRFKV